MQLVKLCRHREFEASKFRWASLPQHLMGLILDSAEAVGGKECIASMRLVSKSWLAAVRAHPMKPKHMRVTADQDLVKLCDIMPHMAGLDFFCTAKWPDLSPLSAQSSLTHLRICGYSIPDYGYITSDEYTDLTDASLSCLPSSLRSLVLERTHVLPGNLGSLKFVRLRSLTFDPASQASTTQKLLECLPELKELHLSEEDHGLFSGSYSPSTDGYKRCLQSLTYLKLSRGDLTSESAFPCMPALQELHLNILHLHESALNLLAASSPSLTVLQLRQCWTEHDREEVLNPIHSLHFLLLEAESLDSPLDLGHEGLQSLSLNGDFRRKPQFLQKLASLTGLTRLELKAELADNEEEIAALRNLRLQELALIESAGLEMKLFVPGALTRLRMLHIEDRNSLLFDMYPYMRHKLGDREQEQLKRTGDIVLELDGLTQISGRCNLFVVGMRQGLEEWEEAALPEGTMLSAKMTHCIFPHLMKVLTRSRG